MKRIVGLLMLLSGCITAAAKQPSKAPIKGPSKIVVTWLNPSDIIVPGDTLRYLVSWTQVPNTPAQRPYTQFDLELLEDSTTVQTRTTPYVAGTLNYSDTLSTFAPQFDSVLTLMARLRSVTIDTTTAWINTAIWTVISIPDPPTPPVIVGVDTLAVIGMVDLHLDPHLVSVMTGAVVEFCTYAEMAHPDSLVNWFAIPTRTGCSGPNCTNPGVFVPQRADCFGIRFDDFVFRMASSGIG